MTSYPTQYNFFVLAYYHSGASRTKYKGDDKTTAVLAYEKAAKQTNIDTVALYEHGTITRESNAEKAQESSKKKSMSLSIGDLVKVIQTGEIVEIIHFEKNSEIILCRGNNSKRLTYTASELTRLSEADEISLVSEEDSQKGMRTHKEIEQDFWSKAHKENTEERKDIVSLDGENLQELTVEKLTDITGIVSLNGKQIKVKLNSFYHVWYQVDNFTEELPGVCIFQSFFKERVVLYSYELMALENQGLISSVFFIEEENRWIKIYSPLQKLSIYCGGMFNVTVVLTRNLDSVTVEEKNTGKIWSSSFENLMLLEKQAIDCLEREEREEHVSKIQHVCSTLAQMNMFLSVPNVRDFCTSIHGIHPREDLIILVLGKFILKLPETVGGLVAVKGSKYTRRIDVTTTDFMSGHIRMNGKIIPVRSYDGLGKWYEAGMDKEQAMFILEAGKVL